MKDYYSILGIQRNATAKEIKAAYIKRVRIVHPDRFDRDKQADDWKQANEMLRDLNEAYRILNDTIARSQYDADYNTESTSSSRQAKPHPESEPRQKPTQEQEQKQETDNHKPHSERQSSGRKRGFIFTNYSKLPSTLREIFINRQSISKSDNFIKVKFGSIAMHYLYTAACALALLFILNDAYKSRWSSDLMGVYAIFSYAIVTFGAHCIRWSVRWHKAKLKCFYYLTPLYFIKTDIDEIRYCWIWECDNFEATHKYDSTNHYKYTTAIFTFAGVTEKLKINAMSEWNRIADLMRKWEATRLESANKNHWEWFENNDYLRHVSGFTNEYRKKMKSRILLNNFIYYSLSLIVGVIIFSSIADINRQYSKESINRYSQREPNVVRRSAPSTPAPAPAAPVYSPSIAPKKEFDKPILRLPSSGTVYRYVDNEPIAPLKVSTTAGSHYYIKVVDVISKKTVVSMFIHSGETAETTVPIGNYYVRYATGNKWYGRKYLFGPETQFYKCDREFEFRIENDRASGYQIQLIKQRSGNLRTSSISADDF